MNNQTSSNEQTHNYRIFDRTGGGVTLDIYAESLEDAIKRGRAWIEGGDWSGCGDDEDGQTYKTLKLECCVGEIVLDEDGEVDCSETYDGAHDCSGTYTPDMPKCKQAEHAAEGDDTDDKGHVWESPKLLGGCRENPGVWSTGGTSFRFSYVCRLCGQYKHEKSPGSQRNSDEPLSTITIKDRDEVSEKWLKETHEEDGFLPAWLAELLDCPITTQMTEAQAREYVESHDDSDDLDEDDLEHAFAALHGRRADDQERAEGLWSHLCAAA